jgi:hypothetical protein
MLAIHLSLSIRASLIHRLVPRRECFASLGEGEACQCVDTRNPEECFSKRVFGHRLNLFSIIFASRSWPCKSVVALRRGVPRGLRSSSVCSKQSVSRSSKKSTPLLRDRKIASSIFFSFPQRTPTHTGFATFLPSFKPVLSSKNSLQLTGTI